jgi:hypothetical protein
MCAMRTRFLEISYIKEKTDVHSLALFNPSDKLIFNIDIYIYNTIGEKYHYWISSLQPKTGKTIYLNNNPSISLWHFQGEIIKVEIESQNKKQLFIPIMMI